MIRKLGLVAALGSFLAAASYAHADDSKVEKASEATKQAVKKAGHRVEESTCRGSKAKCAAKKAVNRVDETTTRVVDKVD